MSGLLAALAASVGCGESSGVEPPALARVQRLQGAGELPFDATERYAVPPLDGPRLAPLTLGTRLYASPDERSEKIGYLRLGAVVARSREPVSYRGCPAGWYAVRPVGFACSGPDATVDLEQPLAVAARREPDRASPMPYPYAFVRSVVPNYLRIPTREQQLEAEADLGQHLRQWRKRSHQRQDPSVGANDVPLDARGIAVGPVAERAAPRALGERFGGDGTDAVPWWLQGGRKIPNVSTAQTPPSALLAGSAARHAGVALVDTFVAGPEAQGRRFAVTTDLRLLPVDKLRSELGSAFHGTELKEGLPLAFAQNDSGTFWTVDGDQLTPQGRLTRRRPIALTGKVRMIRGVRIVQTREGSWVRSRDVQVAVKPRELPWFAHAGERWIDISLVNQTLVLWEGERPVFATLVSTGRDGLGDPSTTLSTPRGVFRIRQKHVTTTMDSAVADDEFELRDVPWVMYFKGGYALHAAYWHDDFGRMRSHGCVNLSPIDARHVFEWSLPNVPEHWHGAYASDVMGSGTIVRIGR